MSEVPKILILENSFDVTGAFKSIFGLTQSIRHEFKFHFAIRKKTRLPFFLVKEKIPFIELYFLEISKHWKTLFYLPMLLLNTFRIVQYINRQQIRIVHINDLYNMIGVLIKILNPKIKVIYHVRLMPDSYAGKLYPFWLKLINRWADQVIVVSEAVYQSISTIVSRPIQIIYDFVPLEEKWNARHDETKPIKFVYPANYTRGKGQNFALKAFAEAYRTRQDILLTFYGSDAGVKKNDQFKNELIRESDALGLKDIVLFEGPTDNIEKIIKEADVVLMFSESESFSLVCYETMYYGRPIIASDCGGPRELIEDLTSGILVPNKDVTSMAKAIAMMASSSDLRDTISKKAYLKVRDKVLRHDASGRLNRTYKHQLA
jgi:L-malate glycosyltransferase